MRAIERVLFMGSKRLGIRVLEAMHALAPEPLLGVVTIDDAGDGRTALSDFRSFAAARRLPLHIARDRSDAERIVAELEPDLCLVVGWYWLIREATLSSVPHGFIGIHNSLLPRLRGGAPLVWSILNGDQEAGFSLFSFTPGMDDGPLWAQGSVPIEEHDSVAEVLARLEARTMDVFRDVYPRILRGHATPVEQDHDRATYCAQRCPEDGNIDWHRPARAIHDFIRAQSEPYPGAFTYLDGQLLKIWKASRFDRPYHGTPGQVARVSSEGVFVICGDDRAIVLEDVELGGKRGRASELIRSIRGRMSPAMDVRPVPSAG
jgi:methionyl-tRNA formyltransferase